jgi:hypothetical protein
VREAVREHAQVLLVGEPGAGKAGAGASQCSTI